MAKIKRALLSVSDKTGLVSFAAQLAALNIELISTGGTAKALTEAGLAVTNVSDVTQFPEMLDGRVKTLHPAIHGGILAVRSDPAHMEKIAEHNIQPIDLVVVNLYPFEATVAKPFVTREEAIENIDIGGPSMVRSAAKNHAFVAVIVSPDDYMAVTDELLRSAGELSQATRDRLAAKAFQATAAYDSAISGYLSRSETSEDRFPETMMLSLAKVQNLRYGENPHQKAAFYKTSEASVPGITNARKLHGKELSFNNIYDLNAAYNLVQEFAQGGEAAVAIIKHTNPCGMALASTLAEAFVKAKASDPISAFGGIVAASQIVDLATAEAITGKNTFFEAIIAPGYTEEALTVLMTKKAWSANFILLECPNTDTASQEYDFKRVNGGFLVQSADQNVTHGRDLNSVSKRTPTNDELKDLMFAWKVVKHVKSNAIVLAKDQQLIGVGAGQMNRVQSVRLAVEQAGEKAKGAVLASDAFFPYPDGPETAAKVGVTAIIQPGGSKKDDESILIADTYNVAMVLTGARHFRH